MKRSYESGASKRQKKKFQELAIKSLKPISHFFNKDSSNQTETPAIFNKEDSVVQNAVREIEDVDESTIENIESVITVQDDVVCAMELQDENCQLSSVQTEGEIEVNILNTETIMCSDIGMLDKNNQAQMQSFLKITRFEIPKNISKDAANRGFPYRLLSKNLANGEKCDRDWICWSVQNQSIYCAPCYILNNNMHFSYLTDKLGYNKKNGWKKLNDRIPSHENSILHREMYMSWKNAQKAALANCALDNLLVKELKNEVTYWKKILERFLDIIFFLSERGLPFFGSNERIGNPNNGNFLGLVELLSKYDAILSEHVTKVRASQEEKKRLQVHYLSNKIQNEFIDLCGSFVQKKIINEINNAKYFSIIADATPDTSHKEQTTLIIRYVKLSELDFSIEERFISFDDFSEKTGKEIASRLLCRLKDLNLNFQNCVGQGYDNGANMAGKYNGVQALLLLENSNCTFSSCGNHTLNLVGVDSAESCKEAIKFFGTIQQVYNFFSSSPKRWEVLKKHLHGISLHNISKTRWSARIDAVKPVALHLKSLLSAVNEFELCSLSADAQIQIESFKKYLSTFECVLMSTIWMRVLVLLHQTNLILQARKSTLTIEKINIDKLIEDVKEIKNGWGSVFSESKKIAAANDIVIEFATNRPIKDQVSAEVYFHNHVFNKIIDSIIFGLTQRFKAVSSICNLFEVLWNFDEMEEKSLIEAASILQTKYKNQISEEIVDEFKFLKRVYKTNFKGCTKPCELLKDIIEMGFLNIYPNIAIALRIFLTLPVSVAEAERSFSVLKRIKNYLRSTMLQDRVNGLATLNINCDIARNVDYSELISSFAALKARKAHF